MTPNRLAYAEALSALESRGRFGIRLGLSRTRALLAGLGNPERGFRGVLITGTNGKGSVHALVASGGPETAFAATRSLTLTLALPARPGLPDAIVQDGFVAARVSPHPLAHTLVRAFGKPITATSANPAGAAPTRGPAEVRTYFGAASPFVLDGGETPGGLPSTLVRVRGDVVEVLRQGAITL